MKELYDLVDQIYCINLLSREDRYESMLKFQQEENIKLNFHRSEKNLTSGRVGCFTSHINCVRDAYLKNYQKILIFEDDIVKTKFYNKINWREVKEFIQENNSWEIIKFSSTTNPLEVVNKEASPHLYNAPTLVCPAYLLNRRGIEKIMDTFSPYLETTQIDMYYYKIFSKTTLNVMPIAFDQRWDIESDNFWEWALSLENQKYLRDLLNYNVFYYMSLFKYYNKWLAYVLRHIKTLKPRSCSVQKVSIFLSILLLPAFFILIAVYFVRWLKDHWDDL